jgi:hypothetical protein
MSTPEGSVKLKIKEYLNSLAPALWYWMPVNMGYGITGIPDFVGCYKGRFFTIEAKRTNKDKPPEERPRQKLLRVEKIEPAGALCIVADDLDTVKRSLEPFKDAI